MRRHSIILLFGFYIFSHCTPQKKKQEAPEAYKVIKPIYTDTIFFSEYVADIQSLKFVEIRSRVKGYLEKIHVDEGQSVSEGQLLFSVSSLEYQKELQKAEAAFKNAVADLRVAEVELMNVMSLTEKSIVSKTELEMVKAKVEALKANVDQAVAQRDQANLNLSYAKIRAPYKGVINRIPNKVGSYVEEGTMLTSISDNNEVYAYFNLSETDYLNYRKDKEGASKIVTLKLANNSLYPYSGKIEIIESVFDQATGNIAFRAKFPNPDGLLKHGANGKIMVKKALNKALLIPQKSTFDILDKVYVFVVKADSTLEQRSVTPRMRLSDLYAIGKGLKAGETLLMEGVENARDGLKISPVLVEFNSAIEDTEFVEENTPKP